MAQITGRTVDMNDAGAPFGSVFGPTMAIARFDGLGWTTPQVVATDAFSLHPGTHALHYGSSCFEGLKAHRQPDGAVVTFRADMHVARLRQSAARLCLPVPPVELVDELIERTVAANEEIAPSPPGSLYLRPTMLGTDVTIGAAATPSASAVLYVLACPVGDYLPPRPLTIAVETVTPRTTPQFGVVKTGANYAMALAPISTARERYGADQVLFAPGGRVEETGASNVVLIDGDRLLTPALTDAYLHGVTRDSLLRLARHLGWSVEEREVSLAELVEWIARPSAELALTGTAAVVAPVGTLVVDGSPLAVGTPGGGAPRTAQLRAALIDIQTGRATFRW
jgi:branched-chain amino acid aminotransferase